MVDDKRLYKRPTLLTNIKRMMALPCSLDGLVYVELAVDAIIDIAIEIASPDPKEIYHKVAGEPLIHTIRRGADAGRKGAGIEKRKVFRWLGRGLGLYDAVVWYMFLMYAAYDGLYDSTSQLLRFDPCHTNERPGDGVAWISALYAKGTWSQCDFQFNAGSHYYPVSSTSIFLSSSNNWTGVIAASTKWRIDEFTYVPVNSRIKFVPRDAPFQVTQLDSFRNNDPDDPGAPTTDRWNHIWSRYQSPRTDGNLICEFQWNEPTAPPNAECFLDQSSHCFLSGG